MTPSLILASIWAVVAIITALLPGRIQPSAACGLIAIGIPLLGWVTWQNGPIWGLLVLAAGASLLRWPILAPLRPSRDHAEWQEPAE